jgi:hypothetical protein
MNALAQKVFSRSEPDIQESMAMWHAEVARLLRQRRKLNRDLEVAREMLNGLRAQRKQQVRR